MCFPPRTAYVLALMHEHKPRLSCVPHKNPSCCRAGRFLNDFSLSIVCSTISIIVTQQIGSYWINYLSLQIYTGTMEKSTPWNNSASSQRNNDLNLRHWEDGYSDAVLSWGFDVICVYIYYMYMIWYLHIYIYIYYYIFSKFPTGLACAGCGQLAKCSDVLFCPIDFQAFWYPAPGASWIDDDSCARGCSMQFRPWQP